MAPSCVAVGQLASQYGVGWAICICGVLYSLYLRFPSLASVSAISLPIMPECARALCACTIAAMSNLSGWWCSKFKPKLYGSSQEIGMRTCN